MTKNKLIYFTAFFTIGALVCISFISGKWNKGIETKKGFAVIELFTSEGCSSCPPADELVARIQKEYANQPVYIMAYHVDYWNHLGWKDSFSNADFSKRQHDYANYLHLASVYTPQIVVNGKTEFVGSQEGNLRNALKANLQKSTSDHLILTSEKINDDKATLKYDILTSDKNTALFVAVIQKSARTSVKRGENAGHVLSHVQIVQKLQKVQRGGNAGLTTIVLPHNFDLKGWEIIGFLQNMSNGSISAGAKVDLNTNTLTALRSVH